MTFLRDTNWEHHAWAPDGNEHPGVWEAHGSRAVRPLNTPAQRAHRLSTVESVFTSDDETVRDWHRRNRG